MELIKFIFATAGLVMILNISKLFKPIREKITLWHNKSNNKLSWFVNSLLGCSLCMGFWAGMVVYVFQYKNYQTVIFLHYIWEYLRQIGFQTVGYGCIGACMSLIIVTFYQLMERRK